MFNMHFMIAHVKVFVSGTMITFSERLETKMKSKKLSEFGYRTNMPRSRTDTLKAKILVSLIMF